MIFDPRDRKTRCEVCQHVVARPGFAYEMSEGERFCRCTLSSNQVAQTNRLATAIGLIHDEIAEMVECYLNGGSAGEPK
jgi:hypothetical protein